jgi:hypothetical protein
MFKVLGVISFNDPAINPCKIYQLTQQYNFPMIEDTYDHEFHYIPVTIQDAGFSGN